MSSNSFKSSIAILQGDPDPKSTLKALICIRNEVDWPKNRRNVAALRLSGCFKQIVNVLLRSNQKKCLDLALSILGNCVMERESASEVVTKHNIISVLNHVLKKYSKEDSISGRTCRIIGNMCQHRDGWATIIIDKKPFIISHMVKVVENASKDDSEENITISEASKTTVIRALRLLCNAQTIETLVIRLGVLKAIGGLLIKYSNQWQEEKQNEKMILDILRLILEYSKFRCYHSILELRQTERGDSLICLANILLLAPRKIVKIIMNLIRWSQLQSELPFPEICAKFMEVLEKHSIIKEFDGHCSEYLQCLCYLFNHPANRNYDRCGKAIPLLIKLLGEFEEPSNNVIRNCTLLIKTLNKFQYDGRLMSLQLSQGIIQILVRKLSWLVGPPEVANFRHARETSSKRKYIYTVCDSNSTSIQKGACNEPLCNNPLFHRTHYIDTEFDLWRFTKSERSPSPGSSSDNDSVTAFSWSDPASSPNRSLVTESDSDDYSPVCSDVEESDFALTVDDASDRSDLERCSPLFQDGEDTLNKNGSISTTKISRFLKTDLVIEMVRLVNSYINVAPPQPYLASSDLLIQLTKWGVTEEFSVQNVICDIVKCHINFMPLIKTNYIDTLNKLRTIPANHELCYRCGFHGHFAENVLRTFNNTAESRVCEGDIAHSLLKGDRDTKRSLVIAIPYIIKDKSILRNLMLKCGGLEFLMQLLQNDDDPKLIEALTYLASKCLSIDNPMKSTNRSDVPKFVGDEYKLSEGCQNVVRFKFEDGATVEADRDFLIGQSEFFHSLLDGHFMESGQSEIALSKVRSRSFKCLLHLMEHFVKTEVMDIDLDMETLLDVILLSDRYLLVDLTVNLTDSVQQFRINVDTVTTIYKWSIESATNFLRVESAAFALVATTNERRRYEMFDSLFKLPYKTQLVEDMEQLLRRYLSMSDPISKKPKKPKLSLKMLKYI